MDKQNTSKLELEILVVFYAFSDQYGNVDIPTAKKYIHKKFGVTIPDKPFVLTQQHINTLTDAQLIPDIRKMMALACAMRPQQRTPRSTRSKKGEQ